MLNLIIILEWLAIALICVGLVLLLNGEGAHEQKLLIFILCGSLVQNFGYLLEILAPDVQSAVTAAKIENVGSAFMPLCFCWFIYEHCDVQRPTKLLVALGGISCLVLPAVFFNWNGLFYSGYEWVPSDLGFNYLSLSYGPLYYVFLTTRIIIPYLLCMITLLRAIFTHSDKAVRRQYRIFFIVSSLPFVMMIVFVFKLSNVFDLTPLTMAIAIASVVIVVWSKRNYDFRHLAAEKVLEGLGDGVVALDDHDRLISYNQAATYIFPDLPSHKIGENIRVVEGFQEEMLDENIPRSFSINGQHYECHSKYITDESGRKLGCVMLMLDMTDIKAYINEIKRVRQQAEKANVAKSEFLANMSHEIRTPMNAIIGLNDIIMEECEDPQIYSHAKDVQSAARNLLAIINDILDLSKVEAGKMELVCTDYHLKTIIDETVGMMDMAASKRGLVLKYDCDTSIPCCYYGDEGRIKQILINILNNAIKFTTEGFVHVQVKGEPVGDEELITVRVEDTGCGIKESDLGKIFDDFRQVDSKRNRSVEGTGLGLAIVKHLVELMKGTIKVESVYGKGTVVTFTILQKIVDHRSIAEVPELQQADAEGTEAFTAPDVKVLVVDDNAVNRKVARGFLKSYALDLTEAGSGQEAIDLVRANKYDIIFMDHMMPVMDGIEAAEIIRRDCGENGTAPVIIALTANAMEGTRERFLDSGFQDFVPKPLDRKELGRVLMRWIPEERRRAADSEQSDERLDPNFFRIEGIDIGAASRYFVGTNESFEELLELYCIDGQRKKDLLCELSGTDLESYCVEVHGLKSASANIGAMKVSNMAREHENAAQRGDADFIAMNFPRLLETYETLLLNIRLFLDSHSTQDNSEKLPALSHADLRKQTDAALRQLECFKSKECMGIVEELLKHELPKYAEESLKGIHEQLKLFEDDNAEALLKKLLCIIDEEETLNDN